ncbi:hypothetical protein CERZMDRAFT_93174 [Cercospora zeae-maydis SCOH1-5]|uniref:Myb-like domain-containing protein n=1 Tax=Cercospora zeae-maydis SCOH1-5 TaxID=717836 RepID=A0A6A6FUF4_9PEZI|nr:hypothetical protein CERZMDRAFT_93174 [Cercospora zeae-maydis SCOH1-5]
MSAINITTREQELLCAVIEVMKADVNWPDVARIANFNTPKQARDKWAVVRKKLVDGGSGKADGSGDENAAATSSTKPKKTPASRKRKAVDEGDAEDATPSKSNKKATAKKVHTPVADDDEEEPTGTAKIKVEQPEDNEDERL